MSESEEHLIAYLLGELPESKNARIEEQYLASDESLALLTAIEAELYDAYASSSLSPERRRLFEQRFLATPEQRGQLEFSRALLRVPRRKQRESRIRLHWPRAAALVMVSAVLIVAVTLWWSARPMPQVQIAQQTPAVRAQIAISFELGSGITRDGGEEPTVELPSNSDVLRITAKVDHDLPSSYSAVLRKPEGTEVWRSDVIRRVAADSKSATVEIPVGSLSSGHYILTLYALTQSGASEVADYAFMVQKP